ncbi:MAG: hypothetical protein RBS08_08650 [Bdellovibrionales bacterium]|jgi:hypothetical protein|nr:hypothetical protein [Bdellovibrionales bacterium]
MSISTVQSENNSGQLIDQEAETRKNMLVIENAAKGASAGGGSAAAPSGRSSDADAFISGGVSGSKYIKGAEFVMTVASESARKPGGDMIFGTGRKGQSNNSQFLNMSRGGGISAMPTSYSDRKMMAKMAAKKPDKDAVAKRALAAKVNGTGSTVGGASYAHGNSAVVGKGLKVSGASIATLSAAPAAFGPDTHKAISNLNTIAHDKRHLSMDRINRDAALGYSTAEDHINRETPHMKSLRLAGTSTEFKQREAGNSHDFSAQRSVSVPTPPGG